MDSFQQKIEDAIEKLIKEFSLYEARKQYSYVNIPTIYAVTKKGFRTALKVCINFQTDYFTGDIYDSKTNTKTDIAQTYYSEEAKIVEILNKIEAILKAT